jgi:hypothetical protein
MTRLRGRALSRHYYPTPDELRGAKPLNELIWFEVYQEPLLELANTHEGRDLLVIDSWAKMPFPVVDMRKHAVTFQTGEPGGQRITDFRSGAYWGNVIRYRWAEIKAAFDRMSLLKLLALPRLTVTRGGRLIPVPAGAASLTANPDAHPESSSVDGSAYRYTAGGETWDNNRTGAGNQSDDTHTTVYMQIEMHTTTNHYRFIRRGFLLFDTSVIGAGGTVSAAVMSITVLLKEETIADSVSVVASNPASNTDIVNSDFETFGPNGGTQTILAPNMAISSVVADSSTFNDFTLNSTGRALVSVDGITKLGCRNATDNTDSEPSDVWESNGVGNIAIISADHASAPAPKLVVTYTPVVFTPRAMMF